MAPRGMNPSSPSMAKHVAVYQIDFTAVASGKRIASSKRRVRWRFGFANPEALAAGQTGTDCRGEEHDVTLVWSITSGKRLVLADGQEVHYSSSRSSIFDFSWTMRGNHVLKIVAHASPPLSPTPGFRQYDFFVDGQSFFTFPKVFRLGLSPNDPRASASPGGSPARMAERGQRYTSSQRSTGSTNIANLEAPNNPDEEEAYLQEAIRQSLEDDKPAPDASAGKGGGGGGGADLLDFGGGAPAEVAPPALPPSTSAAPPGSDIFGAPPPQQQQPVAALPPSTSADPFGGGGGGARGGPPPAALPPSTAVDPFGAQSGGPPPAVGGQPGGLLALPSSAPTANGYAGQPPPQQQQQQQQWPPPQQTPGAQPQPGYPAQPPPPQQQQQQAPGQWNTPAPVPTQQQPQFGAPPSQEQVPPSSVMAQQAQATPSTIGFASPPAADFGGFTATPPPGAPQAAAVSAPADPSAESPPEAAAAAPTDPALLSMSTLSGQAPKLVEENEGTAASRSGSLADQAYAKLVNMDTFSLVSSKDEERKNPFEVSVMNNTVGGTQSLADIQAKKKDAPKKEIMKSFAPAPGAMVVSANQNGSYGSQYGMAPGGGMMGQQPQQPGGYGGGMMGQQPPQMMQQQPQQQPPMMQQQQQPSPYGQPYGQQPPQQPFGQAPPPQQMMMGQQPQQQQQPGFGY